MTYNPDESGMNNEAKAYNTLYYHIGREDLEFVDNLRVARIDNPLEVWAYNRKAENGCCGYFDIRVTIDGVDWMLGCNHGH